MSNGDKQVVPQERSQKATGPLLGASARRRDPEGRGPAGWLQNQDRNPGLGSCRPQTELPGLGELGAISPQCVLSMGLRAFVTRVTKSGGGEKWRGPQT